MPTPRNPALKREQSHHPRVFSDFTYAYPVLSRRAGGVSIGVNLNIDKHCNFDCPYCQVDRSVPRPKQKIDVEAVREELEALLANVGKDGVVRLPKFDGVADADKRLKDIAVSGDGEPTMVPGFKEVCAMLAELQAAHPQPFKLVLITNASLLDRPEVAAGIDSLLSKNGEVWAKLDAGTEDWYQKVNISRISLDRVEQNLIGLGKSHSFTVQSMFCGLGESVPDSRELDAYLERLKRIAAATRAAGHRIDEVQLYTLARKPAEATCTPVTAAFLGALRGRIATEASLPARVYGVAA